jgi:hypothetical protein
MTADEVDLRIGVMVWRTEWVVGFVNHILVKEVFPV